jgi:hypothetical protein
MTLRLIVAVLLFRVFGAIGVRAEPVISPAPALPETTRGQEVAVHGKDFPPDDGHMVVHLSTGNEKSENRIELRAKRVDPETLTFPLPPDKVPAGRYVVSVSIADKELPIPGDLRVLADASAPVHLDGVYPVTAYPTDHTGCDFDVAGENLAAKPQDNMILVVGRGPVSVGDAKECEEAKATGHYEKTCLYVDPGMETRKLHVVNFPRAKYDGPIKIQVQVGTNLSDNALPLVLSRVSERGALIGALVAFAVIMLSIGWLVWTGVGDHMIGGKRYGPWTSFFLDKETNTYSLSKFQLLLWTSVFVFGYVYLFLCRILIQWKFDLPPVPDGLPGMLAISAGAAVAAAGVTEARGTKGSGPVYPSAADFVSTGGLVVGERFQFFVWTLVGAFEFVSMLLLTDPSSLTELPKIPDNFLYLMGISSVGYLGGKMIRKPGPVVRGLVISTVTPPAGPIPAAMTIRLQGENLADNAIVKVDDKTLRLNDEYVIVGMARQDQPVDPAFCSAVEVTLKAATAYLEGEHTLALTNRDGQAAAIRFPCDPLTIDSVETVKSGTTPVSVKVRGKNFGDGTTAEWKDAGAARAIPVGAATKASATELTVELIPGAQAGTGTLTLISALGLRATTPVTIA